MFGLLNATSTLAFQNVFGYNASTTAALPMWGVLNYLASFGISIGVWLLEALAPFWLILAVIAAFIAVAFGFLFVWTHRHRR